MKLPMRESFLLPQGVYMNGNSLGPLSLAAQSAVERRMRQWQHRAVEAWEEWFTLAERLSPALARLVGAHPDEVIATGTTTGNLHAALAGLYRPEGRRRHILALASEFPSDLYALRSWTDRYGAELRLVDGSGVAAAEATGRSEVVEEGAIEAALSEAIALVWLPVVSYRAGQRFDTARLTAAAHEVGALAGWDAAHSIGALPHSLHEDGADVAVWCSQGYLNGGPGAPGGLFVHRRHAERTPGLPGWWGHDPARRFGMQASFEAAGGAAGWQTATPSVLALAGLQGALALFEEVAIEEVRDRSLALTDRLIVALDRRLPELELVTPRQHEQRGGHVTVRHPAAGSISAALRRRGVVPDHRPPDLIRFAPVAMYTTEEEVDRTIEALRAVLDMGEHLHTELRPDRVP